MKMGKYNLSVKIITCYLLEDNIKMGKDNLSVKIIRC